MKRSHRGISPQPRDSEAPVPNCPDGLDPDPVRRLCRNCGRRVMFVRKVYGPTPRAAHWQHVGDGLAQYRSWGVNR